ncbi:MAG TPA: hypothetical protein VKJ65_09680 [Phycisphaerae bacterium]|nr:hypothetical protein [Phycisphaerae bacterium]
MMNDKLNVPDDIAWGKQEYSWRMYWKVNGWLVAATLISGLSEMMFPFVVNHWPLWARLSIVAAEFFAILLWIRAVVRWIRGMDEMHRRITTSAILCGLSATFFFMMLWHRLDRAGLFAVIFPKPKNGGSWDICNIAIGFLLLVIFYGVAQTILNRRYK